MKLTQLGTGAAERIPALFCARPVCKNAREQGGKEIRTQTQALIDDDLLIDFGSDSYLHFLNYDLPFDSIQDLLVTHWHADHFIGEDVALRMSGYGNNLPGPLTVYSTGEVKKFYDRAFDLEGRVDPDRIRFKQVGPGDVFTAANGKYKVQAFRARHAKNAGDAVFYGITDGESTVLYMHDTGYPSEEVLAELRDSGLGADYVSMDCTQANLDEDGGTHMTLSDNISLKQRLLEDGVAHKDTIFVANHISHNGKATHEELSQAALPHSIAVAYDGMVSEF